MKGRTKSINKFSIYDLLIYAFITMFSALTLYPFLNVLATSLSPYEDYLKNPMMIVPKNITFDTYVMILRSGSLIRAFGNTVLVTAAHSLIGIVLITLTAYPLARREIRGRRFIMLYFLFTMLFNGGMIPNYVLIRDLNLYNSLWALIIPGCMGAWSIFIMQNFIAGIPESLRESALLDGAGELQILARVVVPLIGPATAYLLLTLAVGSWNSYFGALIYLRDREKWTLQLYLREILLQGNTAMNTQDASADTDVYFTYFNIKTANIVISILPIICTYPFLQKYFTKGALIGAVKG